MSEQVETPDQVEQPDAAELGDGGKKALAAEREARKVAEREAAEYRRAADELRSRIESLEKGNLSELELAQREVEKFRAEAEQLRSDIQARDLQILKQQIGSEMRLPKELIERLRGDDEESIRADAQSLAGLVPDDSPFPKPDPSQGGDGVVSGGTTADAFAAFVNNRL